MVSFVVSGLPRLIRKLRREPFDVIHCHCAIPTGLLVHPTTRFSRTPYVVTAHGSDVPGYNPDRFTREHRITPPVLRIIMNGAARVTAPSRYLCALIAEKVGPIPVDHVPNGIHPGEPGGPKKKNQILMAGRFLRRKGFQYVLQALKDIDEEFEVHIAGDGPLREELRRRAAELDSRVTFHGWLAHDSRELRSLYDRSAILCLPSEKENASMALLEGMRTGMAVIASDTAGCPEIVGDAGLLVPPQNVPLLRDALERLLSSEETTRMYGQRARSRVTDVFDWEVIGSRYLDLLQQAASRDRDA
jgi:glycosyltransferase involved in cell wall biosynthesis